MQAKRTHLTGPTIPKTPDLVWCLCVNFSGYGPSEHVLEPIPNIFATGNAAEAILGGHYTAPGVPIASGFVGAYRIYKALNLANAQK